MVRGKMCMVLRVKEKSEEAPVWSTVPSELINDGVTTDNGRGR